MFWTLPILIFLAVFETHPAFAQETGGQHFLSLGYGQSYLNELDGTSDSRVSLKNGNANRLAWGGQVSSVRVEYSLSRSESDLERFENSSGTFQDPSGSLDRTSVHLDFYGYEDFPDLGPSLTNYWGLGIGMIQYRLNLEVPGEISVDDTDNSFVPAFFVGWEWIVTRRHRLSLQYRYTMHPGIDFKGSSTGQSLEFDDFRESMLMLNYRWFY